MAVYVYEGGYHDITDQSGWLNFGGAEGGTPGADDLVLIPPGDSDIVATASADLGTTLVFGGSDLNLTNDSSSATFTLGTTFLMPGAQMDLVGGAFDANDVMLTPDSELVVTASASAHINELMNVGGAVIDQGNLMIGGPAGFEQYGVTTPGETNLNSGGQDYINLGNIVQGSSAEGMGLGILNGTSQAISWGVTASGDVANTMGFPYDKTAFDLYVPPVPETIAPGGYKSVASILVNTNMLGTHIMGLESPAGYSVAIVDTIVAA